MRLIGTRRTPARTTTPLPPRVAELATNQPAVQAERTQGDPQDMLLVEQEYQVN